MEIKFEIVDNKVQNFTGSAITALTEHARKYTLEVINEAEKVEKLTRENGAAPEITNNTVFQAARRNKTVRKKSRGLTIIRIIAEIALYVSGIMFLPDAFVTDGGAFNLGYFILFLIVTMAAIVAIIAMHFMDGE